MSATTAKGSLFKLECTAREMRMKFFMTFRQPKMYRYAQTFQWQKIVDRCRKRPRVAAREAQFRNEYASEQTPLHLLLEPLFLFGVDFPSEMMETRHEAAALLLELYPQAAKVPCSLGAPPLALVALDPQANLKDLDMLLKVCPESASMRDLQGRVPLHYACINNRNNLCMIQQLVKAFPGALSVQDKLGRTPLHYAAMADPVSVKHDKAVALQEHFEGAVVAQSSKGSMCSKAVMEILLSDKVACSMVDKQGMTPLHCLCRYLAGLDDVSTEIDLLCLLVKANPAVVSMEDNRGRTPNSLIQKWQKIFEGYYGNMGNHSNTAN